MKRKKKKTKISKKDKKIYGLCIFIFIICVFGLVGYYYFDNNNDFIKKIKQNRIKIVDENSNSRPLAVMIDNNVGYNKHAGLQESYINYEIIVEGGYTRIMALFKDKDVSLIGPVRSSRHYFLDYSLESDSIYSHYGWSSYAENDIKMLNVDNINGMTVSSAYWRDNKISDPHNVYTNTESLYNNAKKLNYNLKTTNWELFKYSSDNIIFNEDDEDLITLNNLVIKYSNNQITSYQYDQDNQYYLRFMDNNKHIDKATNKQLHYKNIIIESVENYNLDSEGRQNLNTVGKGNGYYITNGYALPITWEKNSRKEKTVYRYLNNKEIKLNDGNTFIQIIPSTTVPEFS